jgi:hypothetical protein
VFIFFWELRRAKAEITPGSADRLAWEQLPYSLTRLVMFNYSALRRGSETGFWIICIPELRTSERDCHKSLTCAKPWASVGVYWS